MSEHVVLMTTLATSADAERLAEALVKRRLAACVQMLEVRSAYVWRERACLDRETLLLIKTRAALQEAIAAALAELHPYELPELIAAPVSFGSEAYLAWIDAQTASPDAV